MRHLSSHCSTTLWLSAHMLSSISEKYQSHILSLSLSGSNWGYDQLSLFNPSLPVFHHLSSDESHRLLLPSSRYDAVTPAPSSRYDAGSSEQVFCTWLIREWNFAYLHHIHTRESPSEYSEGRYWSSYRPRQMSKNFNTTYQGRPVLAFGILWWTFSCIGCK